MYNKKKKALISIEAQQFYLSAISNINPCCKKKNRLKNFVKHICRSEKGSEKFTYRIHWMQ
jgi:hypothetical protein